MGQALLPEHFIAQEQSLREELYLRLRMQPTPSWGIGTLPSDSFQLVKGILTIQELTLVLPAGTLVDIPGNSAPAILTLNSTGETRARVFVHLQSGSQAVHVAAGDPDEEGIQRTVQVVELSTNQASATSAQSFELASFECGATGEWSLAPAYVPPLLRLGSSPFFEAYLERMRAIVRTLRQVLMSEIQENYLEAESQVTAKQAMRGLFEFQ